MRHAFVLMTICSCVLASVLPAPGYCVQGIESESRKLREDIQIINLLNGLELSRDQLVFIMAKAREVQRLRDSARSKIFSAETDLASAYVAIRNQVQMGRVVIEKEDTRRFHKIKAEVETVLHQARLESRRSSQRWRGAWSRISWWRWMPIDPVLSL